MKLILTPLLTLALIGCGSGSKDTSLSGQLTGTSIQGLSYQTASMAGTTDSNGVYKYQTGESIQFFVGATLVGENVSAQAQLAIHDLLPDTVLYTTYGQLNQLYSLPFSSPTLLTFNQFHNTLAFLYSLDADANPDNGINIPAGVSELMADTEIDFSQNVKGFTGKDQSRWGDGDDSLRRVTHQGTELGLLSRGTISSYGLAIEHYYQANNIEHNLQIDTTTSIDNNADQTPNSITTYEYNDNGLRTNYTEDDDADGNPSEIKINTYNSNNRYLSQQTDDSGDGTINSSYTYTLDHYGNTLTREYDSDADQTIDDISRTEYNQYGQMVLRSNDDNADGAVENSHTTSYDSNNHAIRYQSDNDGDGIFDETTFDTFDANGNLTLSEEYDGDVSADEAQPHTIHTYTYDDNGNQLTRQSDYNGDGILNDGDRLYTMTYDDNNNRIRQTRDNDGDGTVDTIQAETYNDIGHNILSTVDEGADGSIDYSYSNSYNEQGYKIGYQTDNNGDEVPDRIDTFSYDENGNRIRFEYDSNGDGQANTIYTYTYNDYGNIVSKSEDSNGNGQVDKITTYTNSASVFRTLLDEF